MNLNKNSKKKTPLKKIENENKIGKKKYRLREIQTIEAEKEIKEELLGNKSLHILDKS